MKALPIRWKFALWAALATGLTLVLFALGTLLNLYKSQLRDVDRQLLEEAGEIATAVTSHPEGVAFTDPDLQLGWVLFGADGRIRRADPRLSESLARQAANPGRIQTYHEADVTWRATARGLDGGILVVGYNLSDVRGLLADLLAAYALSLPLVVLGAAVGGWWVAGRALEPVRTLAAAAEAIQSDRLDCRLPVPPADDEIRRLVTMLNAMLGRLEQSFAQSKRFAADASHELRTPLTIMRGEIETMLRQPGLPPVHENKLLSLQEEIARLDRITEQLLLLARFDAGQVPVERQPVDFSRLTEDACEDAELLTSAHQVTLHREIAPGIRVTGDIHQLRRMLLNLLDNAAKYNHPGGTVWCTLLRQDAAVVLRIANTGPGIPAGLRPLIFQRFFRSAPGQTARPGHGLGLSLGREIALAHGGRLELAEDAAPGVTEFRFTVGLAS